MNTPTTSSDAEESRRLARLRALALLDTPPEAPFEDLARAAASLCGTPVGMVSLVDEHRQWCKASVGLEGVCELPRELSFCSHAIEQDSLLEVEDARQDPRFSTNPLVTVQDGIRFYAGMPLWIDAGTCIGTLAVIGSQPGRLSPAQRTGLAHLAAATVAAIRMRDSLRASATSRQLATLVEHNDDAIVGKAMDGTIVSWNEGAEQLFGYPSAEILGRSITVLFPPGQEDEEAELLRRVSVGDAVREFETVRRRKDGRLIEVAVSLSPIRNAGGQIVGIAKIARDIGRQKARARALAASESRYRALVEEQEELVSLATPDGVLTFVNGAYARHFGRSREQMVGTSLYDYIPLAERASVAAHLAQVCVSRQPTLGENHMISADGQRRWLAWTNVALTDETGRVIAIHSVGRDLTERREMENALRAARADLQAVLDHSPVMISAWNRDCTNRFANPAYAAWWGTTPAAMRGRHVREVIGEKAFAESRGAIAATLDGVPQRFERSETGADGRSRHTLVEYVPGRLEGGEIGPFVFVTDITERVLRRQEAARQSELLRMTLASISEGVITCDADGRVAWMNAVAERMTGWNSADALGRAMPQVFPLIHSGTRVLVDDPVARCLALGEPVALEPDAVLVARDGSEYGVADSAAPIRSSDGELVGAVLVFRDVTEQRRLAGEMHFRATHDALTGVLNRSEFDLRLGELLQRVRGRDGRHALLYVDLDYFKAVNDRCGHAAGDRLLGEIARLFGECVRSRDVVARLGGDEFGILLEDCAEQQAERIAAGILVRLEDFRFMQDEASFRIGASIGLVTIDPDSPEPALLVLRADQACYAAKAKGRQRVQLWREQDLVRSS